MEVKGMIGNGQSIFVQKDFPHLNLKCFVAKRKNKKGNNKFFKKYEFLFRLSAFDSRSILISIVRST